MYGNIENNDTIEDQPIVTAQKKIYFFGKKQIFVYNSIQGQKIITKQFILF